MTSSILCFGEISWDFATQVDILPQGESDSQVRGQNEGPGGCAFNTAAALSCLGHQVILSGNEIGQDDNGIKLKTVISEYALITMPDIETRNFRSESIKIKTPACQIFIETNSGKRSFVLFHQDIQRVPQKLDSTRQLLESNTIQYAFLQCYLRSAVESLLKNLKTKTVLMTQDLLPGDDLIPHFPILQISAPDDFDLKKLQLRSEPYLNQGTKLLIITCGADGVFCASQELFEGAESYLFRTGEKAFYIYQEQQEKPKVLDTTGCGDAFRAGFLYGMSHGKSIQKSLSIGQCVAAAKSEISGSCLPTQLNYLLQKISQI